MSDERSSRPVVVIGAGPAALARPRARRSSRKASTPCPRHEGSPDPDRGMFTRAARGVSQILDVGVVPTAVRMGRNRTGQQISPRKEVR